MNVLTEVRAEELLSSLVPIAEHTLVRTLAEAREVAHQYPVVLKLISPKALHKSDVGGVVVVHSAFELESRFVSLIQVAKDHNLPLEGILVQEYLVGHEFIIGIKKDPTFGHVVMVGFGGIYVEVLKDISFRVCPIDTNDAVSMVDELLMAPIFQGVRGEKPLKKKLLVDALMRVSELPRLYPQIEELDINPFILNHREGKVVDARVVLLK